MKQKDLEKLKNPEKCIREVKKRIDLVFKNKKEFKVYPSFFLISIGDGAAHIISFEVSSEIGFLKGEVTFKVQ